MERRKKKNINIPDVIVINERRKGEGFMKWKELKERINKLDPDLVIILDEDIRDAIENRLKVLELVQEKRNTYKVASLN